MEFISFYPIGGKVEVNSNTFVINGVQIHAYGQYYFIARTTDEGVYQELRLYDFEIDKFNCQKKTFRLIK